MSEAIKVNGRINWQTAITVVVTWLVTAMLAYGAIDARLQVLEDRYERVVDDLREIKADVKALLKRSP